ncbi:TrbG/VirB9 family P-type conjugative transfer protein [Luteitalea sp.]|jgi:type IV secretion system protein VirB9|uniref:TrbG/VirB9 family P-type conjugative transfer protein n=1 Tax=Luteitalea sp. TaxID=2004800 RepID=UPI0025BED3AA|nr:TrbG/VirB9 family P-type conjugative transfer protein [Luteitalea sp.]
MAHGPFALFVSVAIVSLPLPVNGQTVGIREVSATERSVIALQTRLRYTTMIVLPDNDEILDVICGDRDFWVISATQNIAHVKPAKAGAATNLNLVTASGAIYSFLLSEGGAPNASPDLKVYVASDEATPAGRARFYSAAHVEALEAKVAEAQAAIRSAEAQAVESTAQYRRDYPTKLTFGYGAVKYERPFFVRAMWHDGEFTYIKSDARELPALYEVKDDKPAVVNFQVREGTFVVPKVLERGYLAVGEQRFSFSLQER